MADPDKVPETQDDTQATYDPTAEATANDSQPAESSMLSESQDFRLVDEELDKSSQNDDVETQQTADQKFDPPPDKNVVIPTEIPKETEKTSPRPENNDDDDDFVQSSQQEHVSPLKKQISNLISGISQKRKAETTETPPAKFPRTCSQIDALSSARSKLDDDNDLFDEETIDETAKNDDERSNVVVRETPDSCVNDDEPESLQQVEKELEEALSQNDDDDGCREISKIGENAIAEKSDRETTEDKVSSSMTMDEKKSDDDEISSATEITDGKISPTAETTELEKLTTEKLTENDEASTTKSNDDEKSPKNGEQLKIVDGEKSVVDVSPENRDDGKNIVSATSTVESTNDSTIVDENAKTNSPIDESPRRIEEIDRTSRTSEISEKMEIDRTPRISEISEKMEIPEVPSIPIVPNKSRMSIEVIYDKSTAPPEKKRPRELVEIDEDGEKIVLDSSQESCDKSMEKPIVDEKIEIPYKTNDAKITSTDEKSSKAEKDVAETKSSRCLTNGSAETPKTDSDKTTSIGSDQSFDSVGKKPDGTPSPSKKPRNIPEIVISISDSENDSFVADERTKNKTEITNRENSTVRTVEKELSIIVKLKCSINVDETTKEHAEKKIISVHSEAYAGVQDLSSTRRRNSDVSAHMADISGNAGENRDGSPGSVTSIAHPYPLNARLSLASTTSSSSSGSSAASMNAKLVANSQFQLPRGPAKHAKKITTDVISPNDGKSDVNDNFNEWKNVGLLLTSFFNCARDEIAASDVHNGSSERPDLLERITSSTPESEQTERIATTEISTPKHASKRSRPTKTARSKNIARSSGTNGLTKSPSIVDGERENVPTSSGTGRKRKSTPETTSRQSTNSKDSMNDTNDELIGKEVFAKWSDNKYYPGTVIGKTKTKFKVNFYDGQNKLIIEDFIVPMPTILHVGLSVYATSTDDDYGSCGIIIDAKKVKDNVVYTVQTDDQDELRVQIKNIFLTNDQVQVLREETKVELKTPPSTPKHLGKVSLDNVVEGTRRSKRMTTPTVQTPKSKRGRGSFAEKMAAASKPSASGIPLKAKNENDNYETTSDSNYSITEEIDYLGVQPELIGTPYEQSTKGPTSRMKGKARSKKRVEDPEVVAKLGPLPPANSNIFRGMSFILTCASLEIIDRFQSDAKDSNSDPGTENEEEWTRKPFVRERLVAQLTAGGGKLYEDFEHIPPGEYENTKLITNVPNLTKKSLLCLSVGIKAYNHQWIIRCCKENKIVNPSEEELPAGWSLIKQSYVEMFQRRNAKPFQTLPVIVVIPLIPGEKDFVTFWTHICQNAGGAVLLPETPDDVFIEGTVVLTNKRCPSWVIEKAKSWSIPLVSTTWVVQSLIEGNICTYDAHPAFDYNYVKRPSSHISSSKRLQ